MILDLSIYEGFFGLRQIGLWNTLDGLCDRGAVVAAIVMHLGTGIKPHLPKGEENV